MDLGKAYINAFMLLLNEWSANGNLGAEFWRVARNILQSHASRHHRIIHLHLHLVHKPP